MSGDIMQFEALSPQWTSSEAKEMFELLERKISEAFVIPPHLLGASPFALQAFQRRMAEATEHLAQQALELYSKNTMPALCPK